MTEFFWKLLEQVLLAVLPVLAVALVGWLVQKIRVAVGTLDEQKLQTLMWIVDVAVRAAEQAGAAQLIKDKKSYALEMAQTWLASKGIEIDIELLDNAIEAAVWENFNSIPPQALPEGDTI